MSSLNGYSILIDVVMFIFLYELSLRHNEDPKSSQITQVLMPMVLFLHLLDSPIHFLCPSSKIFEMVILYVKALFLYDQVCLCQIFQMNFPIRDVSSALLPS